ncbi:MAG TPA: ATPase domain-containing protein [Nitrososphaeraceae archaeon]|nr:ATPase domain-containing protein [Nitrososphaeraceae archaeon]
MIPGIYLPIQRLGPKILLLLGPPGAGKTMYCRQFLLEGLVKGDKCIFISTDLSKMQFNTLFSNPESRHVPGNMEFINPLGDEIAAGAASGKKLTTAILSALESSLGIKLMAERKITSSSSGQNRYNGSNNIDGITTSRPIRLVIDSMSHTLLLLGERMLIEFVMDLSSILKRLNVTAILTLTTPSTDQGIMGNLSSIVDGIIEMRMKEDSNDVPIRSIRVRHLKGVYYEPKWINFKISGNGTLLFRNGQHSSNIRAPVEITCALCDKPIIGTPLVKSDFMFDSKECMEIYYRLENAYGSKISDTGLPSEAFHASFFFIDIVGLSDPTLSVKRQVQKIQILNELIHSCDSFRKTPSGKKIILPTGDGMAIGFLSNPEAPLELSIQLHRKMQAYNQDVEDPIGVRIGLGSGPVFTVSDLNNIQNIWGPGIILARRVMDAGDNGHILIAEKLAEELISLKDEYRNVVGLISDKYRLKHGQKIKLYSAYSSDFGNPQIPSKVFSNE